MKDFEHSSRQIWQITSSWLSDLMARDICWGWRSLGEDEEGTIEVINEEEENVC